MSVKNFPWILKHMFKAAGSKISLRPAICLTGLTNTNRWSSWKRLLFKNEPIGSLGGFLKSQNIEKIKQKINVADKLVSLWQIWKLFCCTECVINQKNFSLPWAIWKWFAMFFLLSIYEVMFEGAGKVPLKKHYLYKDTLMSWLKTRFFAWQPWVMWSS